MDDHIEKQFKSKECTKKIEKIAKNGILTGEMASNLAIKNRKRVCSNKETPGGRDFREYAPKDLSYLEEGEKTYCFTLEELKTYKIAGATTNPYTGHKLPIGFVNDEIQRLKHIRKTVPIGYQIETLNFKGKGFCPIFRSDDPLKVYTTANHVYEAAKRGKLQIADFRGYNLDAFGIDFVFWEIKLKKPLVSNQIQYNNIVSAKKVSPSDIFGEIPNVNQKVDIKGPVFYILKDYMSRQYKDITSANVEKIMKYPGIRPSKPIKVYRGISFSHKPHVRDWMYDEPDVLEGFLKLAQRPVDFILKTNKGNPIQVGQHLTLESRGNVESWTVNPCISFGYAYSDGNFGIVMEYKANPDEIIMDGNYVKNIKDLYRYNQQEVLLKTAPKRKVKIHTLIVEGDLFAIKSFDSKGRYKDIPKEDEKMIENRDTEFLLKSKQEKSLWF
jgi:hypothetical protein